MTEPVLDLLVRAIADPARFTPRERYEEWDPRSHNGEYESISHWGARAVLYALVEANVGVPEVVQHPTTPKPGHDVPMTTRVPHDPMLDKIDETDDVFLGEVPAEAVQQHYAERPSLKDNLRAKGVDPDDPSTIPAKP